MLPQEHECTLARNVKVKLVLSWSRKTENERSLKMSLVKESLTPHWDNWQKQNKKNRCAVESKADTGTYLEELEAYTNKVSDCRSHLNSAVASPLKQVHPAGSRGMLCCASTHSALSGFQHCFKRTTLNPDVLALFFITFSQENLH